MKKKLFTIGTLFILGMSTQTFGNYASAAEISPLEQEILEQGSASYARDPLANQYDGQEGNGPNSPSFSEKGEPEGQDDPSTVNGKIIKISDSLNPYTTMASGWQYITSDSFKTQSKTVNSAGGNVKIVITQPYIGPGFTWTYTLYEDDGYKFNKIDAWDGENKKGTYELIANVSSYVDGSNKKAELFLKKTVASATVKTKWYD
ncbi:hypothetical protein ACFU1R_29070 [Priestia megaterium]|uniref:hypothetical protein n=1 Tax=Priestia megaterium TaxID=1404 RepID=UPI00366F66C2